MTIVAKLAIVPLAFAVLFAACSVEPMAPSPTPTQSYATYLDGTLQVALRAATEVSKSSDSIAMDIWVHNEGPPLKFEHACGGLIQFVVTSPDGTLVRQSDGAQFDCQSFTTVETGEMLLLSKFDKSEIFQTPAYWDIRDMQGQRVPRGTYYLQGVANIRTNALAGIPLTTPKIAVVVR